MSFVGLSRQGINIFCELMDLCKGISDSAYKNNLKNILNSVSLVFDLLCQKAVKEDVKYYY